MNNPMNAMLGYLLADSRAKHYDVAEPQKIKTMGMLFGMMSNNPLMSYLVAESQAKNAEKAADRQEEKKDPPKDALVEEIKTLAKNVVDLGESLKPVKEEDFPKAVTAELKDLNTAIGKLRDGIKDQPKQEAFQNNALTQFEKFNANFAELHKGLKEIGRLSDIGEKYLGMLEEIRPLIKGNIPINEDTPTKGNEKPLPKAK